MNILGAKNYLVSLFPEDGRTKVWHGQPENLTQRHKLNVVLNLTNMTVIDSSVDNSVVKESVQYEITMMVKRNKAQESYDYLLEKMDDYVEALYAEKNDIYTVYVTNISTQIQSDGDSHIGSILCDVTYHRVLK